MSHEKNQKKRAKIEYNFYRIRWQRENGLMSKQIRRWFPKKPICEGGARGFTTVGLQEVKPALYLLLIGTGLSVVLMFIEIAMHKVLTRQKKKKKALTSAEKWVTVRTKLKKIF